jgi:hypothetical protein
MALFAIHANHFGNCSLFPFNSFAHLFISYNPVRFFDLAGFCAISKTNITVLNHSSLFDQAGFCAMAYFNLTGLAINHF